MPDRLSERDDLTLRTLALLDRTTIAEQRRRALAAYARQSRQDPQVAHIVKLMLATRRKRRDGGTVIRLHEEPGSGA